MSLNQPHSSPCAPVVTCCCFYFISSDLLPLSHISWVVAFSLSVLAHPSLSLCPSLCLCLCLSCFTGVSNRHQSLTLGLVTFRGPERGKETLLRSQQQEGQTLNVLGLPLSPSPHLEVCAYTGCRRHLPCPKCLPSQWPHPGGCRCSAGMSGVASGGGGHLIQKTIPGTCSDGVLCSGITNREIKGLLRYHSGKIKCACTNLFRTKLKLVLQSCTPHWISLVWP